MSTEAKKGGGRGGGGGGGKKESILELAKVSPGWPLPV
jgi:hypothetical protein